MTPLHYAAQDCPEAVPALIEHGADPHARDEGGMTPLHIAALHGSLKAAEALAKHSDVNARDVKGRTPRHLVNIPTATRRCSCSATAPTSTPSTRTAARRST